MTYVGHEHRLSQGREMTALGNLKIPMMLCVVFIHSNFLPNIGSDFCIDGFRNFLGLFDCLLSCAVPTFFFISGYLFFRSGLLTRETYSYKIKRRWRSLIVPYIIWNTIALVTLLIKTLPLLSDIFPQYSGFYNSLLNIPLGYVNLLDTGYPYDFALWFVRNLIILVLVSPLLSVMFRYFRLFVLPLLYAVDVFAPIEIFNITDSLCFFALGAAFPVLGFNLSLFVRSRLLWTSIFIIMVAGNMLWPDYCVYILSLTAGVFMFVSWSMNSGKMCSLKPDSHVFEAIFFLYACHSLYVTIVRMLWVKVVPPATDWLAAIDYILSFCSLVMVTMAIYYVGRKAAPRLVSVMCGGR